MFSSSWFNNAETDIYLLFTQEEENYKAPPQEPVGVKVSGLTDLNSLIANQTKLILAIAFIFIIIFLLR